MRPIIGINCDFQDEDDILKNRQYLLVTYVKAVEQAGGVPVLLPIMGEEALNTLAGNLDGLLMTGGGGLYPRFVEAAELPDLAEQNPVRHEFDVRLVQLALQRNLPILGICRGHQTINEAAGGTMHLNLPMDSCKHKQTEPEDIPTHKIKIAPDSRLEAMLGAASIEVNSFHRQAVDKLAPGLKAVAWSEDGLVEAYEGTRHTFVMGCQFHPETLLLRNERFGAVYAALVKAASAYRRERSSFDGTTN